MISSRADIRTDSDDVFFQPEKNGVCSESLRASTPLPYLIECLRKRNDETARVRPMGLWLNVPLRTGLAYKLAERSDDHSLSRTLKTNRSRTFVELRLIPQDTSQRLVEPGTVHNHSGIVMRCGHPCVGQPPHRFLFEWSKVRILHRSGSGFWHSNSFLGNWKILQGKNR